MQNTSKHKLIVSLLGPVWVSVVSFAASSPGNTPDLLPVERELGSLLVGQSNFKTLYLKQYPVEVAEDRTFSEVVAGRPKKTIDTGHRIIKIGTRNYKNPSDINPLKTIYATNLSCILMEPPKVRNPVPEVKAMEKVDSLEPVQVYDPEIEMKIRRISEAKATFMAETAQPDGSPAFKSLLVLNFTTEQTLCQSASLKESCLRWDQNQSESTTVFSAGEFLSVNSPREALEVCRERLQEMVTKLNEGGPVVVRLKKNIRAQTRESAPAPVFLKPLSIGFSELIHSWSSNSKYSQIDRSVICEVRKQPKRQHIDSLGTVTFKFEAPYTNQPLNRLPSLGSVSLIQSSPGRVGQIPYVNYSREGHEDYPGFEMRTFQYFPVEAPLFAFNKDTYPSRQVSAFPLAIDVVFFDIKRKIMHRTIFDFRYQLVLQQEHYDLPFDSIDSLIRSSTWQRDIKNWLSPESRKNLRPDPGAIIACD